jgi:hypothetical protein
MTATGRWTPLRTQDASELEAQRVACSYLVKGCERALFNFGLVAGETEMSRRRTWTNAPPISCGSFLPLGVTRSRCCRPAPRKTRAASPPPVGWSCRSPASKAPFSSVGALAEAPLEGQMQAELHEGERQLSRPQDQAGMETILARQIRDLERAPGPRAVRLHRLPRPPGAPAHGVWLPSTAGAPLQGPPR